jgi:hypothetical protein
VRAGFDGGGGGGGGGGVVPFVAAVTGVRHCAPAAPAHLGGAVQVDSIKTRVESAPGVCNQRLKLKCDEPLSNVAFNFNVRRYTAAGACTISGMCLGLDDITVTEEQVVGPDA